VFATVSLAAAPFLALAGIVQLFMRGIAHRGGRLLALLRIPVAAILKNIKSDPLILRLYRHMEAAEVRLLHKLIAAR
jgi:hypothetical protein